MSRKWFLSLVMLPFAAVAQESGETVGIGSMYFLGIGLVIFLALVGIYSIVEKIRDAREEKINREEEEARRLRLENAEREARLKSERQP